MSRTDAGREPVSLLRRCQQCGIRVPIHEMVYDARACSEDCADELWIKDTFVDEE